MTGGGPHRDGERAKPGRFRDPQRQFADGAINPLGLAAAAALADAGCRGGVSVPPLTKRKP